MTTIATLQAEVARLEQQRQADHQQYTLTTGVRLLCRTVRARQKMAVRRRWVAWQVGGIDISYRYIIDPYPDMLVLIRVCGVSTW